MLLSSSSGLSSKMPASGLSSPGGGEGGGVAIRLSGLWRSRKPGALAVAFLNLLLILVIAADLGDQARGWLVGSGLLAGAVVQEEEGGRKRPPASSGRADAVRRGTATGPASPSGRNLADWNPFGSAPGAASGPAIPVDAPETQLNLTLKGIIHTEGAEASARAMIHGPSLPEKAFRIDDTLPGNVRVAGIQRDRVLLERGGRFETLRLPRREATGLEGAPSVSGQALKALREEILHHPDKVLEKVRVVPHQRHGVFVGYMLVPGEESGFLEQFDLQRHDVITVVNDVHLTSPIKGMEALGSLANLSSLHLEVLRGMDTLAFNYYLDR